jgi:UDP-glucose 4-epimerase
MTCRFEGVIHFAGLKVAEEKSMLFYNDNLISTINFLQLQVMVARRYILPFLFFSFFALFHCWVTGCH